MAPHADAAPKPRRTVPRIVPAIPLALSRQPRARPITPEGTAPEELQPTVEREAPEPTEERPSPESRGSGTGDTEPKTAAISAGGPEERLDQDPDTVHPAAAPQEAPVGLDTETPEDTSSPPLVLSPVGSPEQPSVQTPSPESNEEPSRLCSTHIPTHNPRPSLDSIVFGTTQSSPAIPSTPREPEPESDGRALPQPIPHYPPGLGAPQFAPPFYPGHSHHPSVPQAVWPHPPVAVGAPNGVQGPPSDFHPPPFSGPVAHQTSYQDQISYHNLVTKNGAASSHSQSPVKSQSSEMNWNSQYGGETPLAPYTNGTGLPATDSESPPQDTNKFTSQFKFAMYMAAQLGNPDFADFILQVYSESMLILTVPVHGIVVSQSGTIASAIRNSLASTPQPRGSPAVLNIVAQDKFITLQSLNEALKLLYGGPLVSVESFTYGLGPFHPGGDQGPTFNEARRRMAEAISYAAAGGFFGMHDMHDRGIEIVKALSRWDTLDQALAYGIQKRAPKPGHSEAPSNSEEHYVSKVVDHCIEFIARNFPSRFCLYTIAPELKHNPRLPNFIERPTHNPRLSRIRFGDAPAEEELKPDYITRLLSSILLSLPLRLLGSLFNHHALVNRPDWAQIIHDVVGERERRRQKALKGGRIMESEIGSKTLLENMFWEERVIPSSEHASGYTLSETRLTEH